MKTCPTCGHRISDSAEALLKRLPLKPTARRIALYLAQRMEVWTSTAQIVAAIYADHPDGGPLTAHKGIMVQVCHIRKVLAGTELEIESLQCTGYRLKWRERASEAA